MDEKWELWEYGNQIKINIIYIHHARIVYSRIKRTNLFPVLVKIPSSEEARNSMSCQVMDPTYSRAVQYRYNLIQSHESKEME